MDEQPSLDRVIDVSVTGETEHDPGCLIAITEQGRIWMLDGDDGYQGDQTGYWYEVSAPPGCLGKHP